MQQQEFLPPRHPSRPQHHALSRKLRAFQKLLGFLILVLFPLAWMIALVLYTEWRVPWLLSVPIAMILETIGSIYLLQTSRTSDAIRRATGKWGRDLSARFTLQ